MEKRKKRHTLRQAYRLLKQEYSALYVRQRGDRLVFTEDTTTRYYTGTIEITQ